MATFTTNTNLGIPAVSDTNYPAVVAATLSAIDAFAAVGSLAVATKESVSSTLNVKVSPGTFRDSTGQLVAYAGTASQILAASTTSYLWLTDAGVLTVGSAWPTATNHVRLAVVVTGATAVSSVADARVSLPSSGATVWLALAGGTMADSAATVVVHAGTTHGVQWGGAATELQAWWGATPVAQPSGAAQAAVGTLALQSLTVSTGGTSSTTLAAATNTATITDGTGGTASGSLATIADAPTANAVASLAAQLATQRALNTVLINAVTSLGTQTVNALADIGALKTLANALRGAGVMTGQIKGS